MTARLTGLIFGLLLILAPSVANAAMMFGKDETIHYLMDTDVTSQDGEPLFLGYKTTIQYFVAGLYVQDDGYVFGLKSDHNKYISTTPEEIANLQHDRLLPDPLPPYKLSTVDYLLGYSLWILIPVVVLFYLIGFIRNKRKTEATESDPPAAA